jgi:hypothetical protein
MAMVPSNMEINIVIARPEDRDDEDDEDRVDEQV